MGDLLPCPFCGGSAKISTRTDECIWSHDQVEWTAVSCSGGPDFDCLQPSVDWPTSATDENDTQLSISQWNRRALPAAPAEDVRAGALKEAEKALRDWQDSLNVQRMLETAVTIGMAADVVAALIPGAKP